jgi:hypothetical protein
MRVGPMSQAGIGRTARAAAVVPWVESVPWLERRVVGDVALNVPAVPVWLSFPTNSDILNPAPSIAARCGCNYKPYHTHTVGDIITVLVWTGWPRDQSEFTITTGTPQKSFLVEVPTGLAPPPASADGTPLLHLPWEADAGNVRVSIELRDGEVQYEIRRIRDGRASLLFRDAKGNVYDIPIVFDRDHPMPLPFGTCLCPHAAWWEMEATGTGVTKTTFRFAPPNLETE